ncbi:MAG: S-layer homology domain-containing protein [Clostridia bacterium]
MISKKKNLKATVRFVLIMFIFCTLVSYTGGIAVNAGISDEKHDLIEALYPILNDDVKREAVFDAIVKPGTYEMKNISTDSAAYDMADDINDILGVAASINRETLKTLLQDFYDYQLSSSSITKFALRQFKNGLDIEDDLYGTYRGFDTIKDRISTYTVNYLLFVNFVKEVKDIYDTLKSQPYNPLYLDGNKKIQIYDDLEALADIADLFTDDDRAEYYKERLLDLLDALNATASSTERENFAKNLNTHNLLDLSKKSHTPTDDDGSSGGGGGGGGGGGTPTPPTTPGTPAPQANSDGSSSVTVAASLNSTTGNTAATVSENIINQLLTLSKPQADGIKDIVIDVPKIDGAKSYTLNLPGNALAKSTASEEITIKTEAGNITLPSNIFANDDSVKNKNISLTITKVDKSTLPLELQQKIGDKPVIALSFTVDGVVKEYNNTNTPVTVSFNYKPTVAEAVDSEFLVVWYMDNAGNLIEVPSGRYDAASGTVSFTTTHFSKYVLAYNHKVFTDVDNTHWAKKTIEILASKGIARGTTDKTFAPYESITRGDYLAMLVRALGVNAVITENFSDIKATDINFKEIAIAKKLGITNGVGNNMFKPDKYITRQDLMVLTERALTALKKIKVKGTAADIEKFSDKSKVAGYARDSVATMIKEGILIGSGSEIGPVEKTTRAQAATIVYRIYNK